LVRFSTEGDIFLLTTTSGPAERLVQILIWLILGALFLRTKRPGLETDHLRASSIVKNEWSYICVSPFALIACRRGTYSLLTRYINGGAVESLEGARMR
jgi:hypothetical protein